MDKRKRKKKKQAHVRTEHVSDHFLQNRRIFFFFVSSHFLSFSPGELLSNFTFSIASLLLLRDNFRLAVFLITQLEE